VADAGRAGAGHVVPDLIWAQEIAAVALTIAVVEAVISLSLPLFLFHWSTIRRGPAHAQLALTIDDGPHPDSTPRWLAALGAADVKATFFCPGARVDAFPELARAIVAGGHELANHSYTHPWNLAFFTQDHARAELLRAQRALQKVAAVGAWFRPVAGVLSPPLAAAARGLGLVPVTWTARAYDGAGAGVGPAAALRRLGRGVVAGGILLAHDNPGSPGPEIVADLRALADRAGLKFVTLSALLAPEPARAPALSNLSISQRDLTSPSP
jgi:peptidoglycan/xylan/chitin deacetylase (PgdA/CDA1 family)